MTISVKWIDHGREAQCAPNPAHPMGIDLDCSLVGAKSCTVTLPYPARRCGVYVVECAVCGQRNAVTTAGRTDDPRSVKIPCNLASTLDN